MKKHIIAALAAPLAFAACASDPPPAPVTQVAQAPAPVTPDPAVAARQACEAAATPAVRGTYRGPGEIAFLSGAPRTISSTSVAIRGTGSFTRTQGVSNFTYSCVFNTRNGTTRQIRITRRS